LIADADHHQTRAVSGKRVLILGGAGFIGRHIAQALRPQNEVKIFDNFSRPGSLRSEALAGLEIIKGDIRDYQAVSGAMRDTDLVVHLAGIAGIDTVTRRPLTTMEVNLIGAYNALLAASKASVDRFVYSSSSEVYGPRVYLGKENDMTAQGPVSEPRWGYAVSKLASDFLAHSFYLENGLDTTSVRYFNVYGPGQVGEGAIHNFIISAIRNEPIRIFGSGLQIRAWTYVDDAVTGTILALTSPDAIGKVYNIGNPATACTLVALATRIILLSNSDSPIDFAPLRLADVELRVPDISLAKHELGFSPQVDLEDGLRRTIDYYRRLEIS
jgi:nucleoside-diphosphate-sugar epimerase